MSTHDQRKLRILMMHNYYQQRGGEDQVFEDECAVLAEHGHEVITYTKQTGVIGRDHKIREIALSSVWSQRSLQDVRDLIREKNPDVAIVGNTFPLLSPSVYAPCHEANIPVIQHVDNYRLACANAMFFRDGQPCEKCIDKLVGWPAVWHACYRDSHIESLAQVAITSAHRLRKTWHKGVTLFITPSAFSKRKLIEAQLPADRIYVKPNFVRDDPQVLDSHGEYALFVGRLTIAKGVDRLLDAWRELDDVPLRVIGDGPLRAEIERRILAGSLHHVRLLGEVSNQEVLRQMQSAAFLVVPSLAYETFGLVIIEAFACGIPVICSDLGSRVELVVDGETGLFYDPYQRFQLIEGVRLLWSDRDRCRAMGRTARQMYLNLYNEQQGYKGLMQAIGIALKK